MDSAKANFVWICLSCGNVYMRPKNLVMNRIYDYGIREASFLYENQIIQGIDACINCNPDLILEVTNRLGECAQ